MVQVTVAIAQFMLMLIEAALWAALVGGGGLLLVALVLGTVFLLARRFFRRLRSRE